MLFSIDRCRGAVPPLSCIILGVVLLNVVAKPQSLHVKPSSYLNTKSFESRDGKVIVVNEVTTTSRVVEYFSNHSAPIVPVIQEDKIENSHYFGVDKFWKRFEDDFLEAPNYPPLNKSNFLISHKRFRRNTAEEVYPHVPRFMMEFFAEGDSARKLPEGATALRSYPIISIEKCGTKTEEGIGSHEPRNFLKETESSNEDRIHPLRNMNIRGAYFKSHVNTKRKRISLVKKIQNMRKTRKKTVISDLVSVDYSINEHLSVISKNTDIDSTFLNFDTPSEPHILSEKLHSDNGDAVAEKENFKMFFNLTFPPREAIHSAVLRIYTRTRRKVEEESGVERRIRVLLYKKRSNIQDEVIKTTIIEKDVYLRTNSWIELDITAAAFYFKNNPSQLQYIEVEVSAEFFCVGEQGKLEFVLDFESSLRPYLLIYTTSFKAIMKEATENVSYRKRRSVNSAEFEEEETNMIWDGDAVPLTGLPPNVSKGKKLGRKARRRRAKNACKRKPLTVEFKEIDWDHWIIAPQTYEAYQCSGKCYYPLPSHLSPTKHAVIQNLIHSKQPESTPRACCVPTKLGPISLLYLEANVPTYDYDYGEMVVLECGCR